MCYVKYDLFSLYRFIGELFKLQMLVHKIMHDCVVSLLKGSDEESLECLCRLLTTIGKELDTEKAKVRHCSAAAADCGFVATSSYPNNPLFLLFPRWIENFS